MKKFFKRFINDIKKSENIEIYLSTLVVIVIIALDLFGADITRFQDEILLSVLVVIILSQLRLIHVIDEFEGGRSYGGVSFLGDFTQELDQNIKESNDLLFIGVTLERTLNTYYSIFHEKLVNKHRIRVLLVDPNSKSLEVALTRNYSPSDVNQTRNNVNFTIYKLCELKKQTSGNLEIRVIDNSLTHGVVGVNLAKPEGILFIENYPYKTIGGSLPKFVLKDGDKWYGFYKKEAEILWENGLLISCEERINENHG